MLQPKIFTWLFNQEGSVKLFQWFSDNKMKANHDKCHLLVSGKNDVTMNASGFKIKSTE